MKGRVWFGVRAGLAGLAVAVVLQAFGAPDAWLWPSAFIGGFLFAMWSDR